MKLGCKVGFIMLSTVMAGCASKQEPVKPRPFSDSNSYAYNLANQTFLTRNYEHGKTIKSPLKDFTQREIQESETNLSEPSNGGFVSAIGIAKILTGNLTGVIDVAGGSAASIAHSNHPSSYSHWVVAIDADGVENGIKARDIAVNTIQTAAIKVLEKKGNTVTQVIVKKEGKSTFGAKLYSKTAYVLDGEDVLFGMYQDDYYNNKRGLVRGETTLIKSKNQYITDATSLLYGTDVFNFNLFIDGYVKGYTGLKGYEQFILDVTKQLPAGYLYYAAPLPKGAITTKPISDSWSCKKCRKSEVYVLSARVVPAIYTQGKKYEFIKPEIKPTTSKTAKAEQGGQGE